MWNELRPWHLIILAVVIFVLFGYKKLPDATRSLGRSLRILKTEVKSLHEDDGKGGKEKPAADDEAAGEPTVAKRTVVAPRAVEPPRAVEAPRAGAAPQDRDTVVAGAQQSADAERR